MASGKNQIAFMLGSSVLQGSVTPRAAWRTSTNTGGFKEELGSGSSSWCCTDLSDAREQEDYILMILQGAEVVCGSQGVLEIPAGCLERSVVHVEGELSFGKSALIEVLWAATRDICTQGYKTTLFSRSYSGMSNRRRPKLSIFMGSHGPPKKISQHLIPFTSVPGLRLYLQVRLGRLHQHPGLVRQRG